MVLEFRRFGNSCPKLLFIKTIWQPKEIVSSIHGIITAEMNDQLSTQFLAWEVQKAINQTAPLKAPSLDGMPPIFFRNYWNLIRNFITQSILQFLNTTSLPPHLNHNFVNLILKVKCPESVSKYKPINLCNVLYKIFLKVLCNRLKIIMPKIITEYQSAFTKSRLISDNILVAFESLHTM